MKKIKTIFLGAILVTATGLLAKPNIPMGNMKAMMKEMAGEKGIFVKNEVFPKDYFLISKSLPFMIGLTLHHPKSSELNLSKKQLEKLKQIKGNTIPIVIESAKKIKKLELELSKRMLDGQSAKENFALVDIIAKAKAKLTKAHLQCIEDVIKVLTKEQLKTLLYYVK
jgi:hypothetical protein